MVCVKWKNISWQCTHDYISCFCVHLAESVKVAEESIVSSSAADISANSVKVITPSPTMSMVSEAQQSGDKKLLFV